MKLHQLLALLSDRPISEMIKKVSTKGRVSGADSERKKEYKDESYLALRYSQ